MQATIAPVSHLNSNTRILLVEDNDISRQLMSDYLRHCGYSVHTLSSGSMFAQEMAQFRPHLVLLDLKLPDIDGFTLLEQAQQTLEWSQTPIVVISAFAFQADRVRALSLGARQYLVKPVMLPQIQQAISDELRALTVQ
ncbi:MAG: response regulator [Tildeniella nuda ZEHNDER 1965/U140]|jgi:two-component system cell cycle response regulator DivK|nr:response regulator [Tildeniella nuda ZEHNDER 1965/U140]